MRGPNSFKNSGSQSEKKILSSTTIKFQIRNLNHDLQISETENKEYMHDFLEPVSNNASSTSPFNATFIGYFDILLF